jgi:hypothetical protein
MEGAIMSSIDILYYRERIKAQHALADSSKDENVVAAHLSLAREYQRMIDALEKVESKRTKQKVFVTANGGDRI